MGHLARVIFDLIKHLTEVQSHLKSYQTQHGVCFILSLWAKRLAHHIRHTEMDV